MEKLFLFLLALVISCKQKSREDLMKDGIKEYLSKTMHDFKSYEPVEFKKPDSTYTNYLTSDRGQALYDSIDNYNKLQEDLLTRAKEYTYTAPRVALEILKEGRVYNAIADSLIKIRDKEKADFIKKFNGYEMLHSFRGKNMNGATILTTKRFYFDTTFTVIKSVEVE